MIDVIGFIVAAVICIVGAVRAIGMKFFDLYTMIANAID